MTEHTATIIPVTQLKAGDKVTFSKDLKAKVLQVNAQEDGTTKVFVETVLPKSATIWKEAGDA